MFVRHAALVFLGTAVVACDGPTGDSSDASPSEGAVEDAGVAPRLAWSVPARGATDVYPAPLGGGTSLRLRVVLAFDAPLDPAFTTVRIGPLGVEGVARTGTLASPTELVVLVPPPPFATTVLADHTTYVVALDALRGLDGAPVHDAPVTFTTGALDPLLNHACGHVALGPFADVLASVSGTPEAPRTDTGHVRYTVALGSLGGGTHGGYTRFAPGVSATAYLFLDEETAVSLDRFDGQDGPAVHEAQAPAACTGIARVVRFPIAEGDVVRARFGPQPRPEAKLIVELVTGP